MCYKSWWMPKFKSLMCDWFYALNEPWVQRRQNVKLNGCLNEWVRARTSRPVHIKQWDSDPSAQTSIAWAWTSRSSRVQHKIRSSSVQVHKQLNYALILNFKCVLFFNAISTINNELICSSKNIKHKLQA